MQRRESGIAGLLGQLRPSEGADPAPPTAAVPEPPRTRSSTLKARSRPPAEPAPATPARADARGAGRSRTGKRSNPDYGLRGLWLRTETYLDVTDRLRRRREYADASELVQTLLEQWLRGK